MLARLFGWITNKEQKFICVACWQQKPATERVCVDPQLCSICVDADNEREYELTFGGKNDLSNLPQP